MFLPTLKSTSFVLRPGECLPKADYTVPEVIFRLLQACRPNKYKYDYEMIESDGWMKKKTIY